MGATIQRTRYSSETKRVLQDHFEAPTGSDIKVISGINILTNNQVCNPSLPFRNGFNGLVDLNRSICFLLYSLRSYWQCWAEMVL